MQVRPSGKTAQCRSRLLAAAAIAFGLAALAHSQTLAAALPDVAIDDTNVYPESMSAAPDGTVYIGSIKGIVFRAAPGSATAEPWIEPGTANGLLALLGQLADVRSNTLWVCSSPMPFRNPPAVGTAELAAFNLKTGALKATYPLPPPASVCNDITIAKDGTAFVSETANGRIFTLAPGAKALTLFGRDPRLVGIDGIVFGGDGTLYADNARSNQLLRIDRNPDGSYAGFTVLATSQPVGAPDGFRLIAGNKFLLAEGSKGRIDEVRIDGDDVAVHVLKDGLQSPPGVTPVGDTAYALEGKILYLVDPKLKGKDPGPFKAYAVPLDDMPR
jgi:outer membrane protein assembly factor BamB